MSEQPLLRCFSPLTAGSRSNEAFGLPPLQPPSGVSLEGWSADDVVKFFQSDGKTLPTSPEQAAEEAAGAAHSAAALRWSVDISGWEPLGEHEGAEFRFLLSLVQ